MRGVEATVLSESPAKATVRPAIRPDLSNLAHDEGLWQSILSHDLSFVTSTFVKRNPKFADDAKVLEQECKRFMYLTAIAPNFELAPTHPIDEYWHQFILFTKEYTEFCDQFRGRFVHHKPLGADNQPFVFKRTQKVVVQLFGEFENKPWWFLPATATSCCSGW